MFTMTKAVRLEKVAILFLVLLRKVIILKLQKHFPKKGRVARVHLAVRQKELK